jgi:hypothetical protein
MRTIGKTSLLRTLTAGVVLALACVTGALAQGTETVNVYQYAVDHPVADVSNTGTPSLGASVPQTIELATVGENKVYGYFYFEGRPVIVDMATRAVVRIDQ